MKAKLLLLASLIFISTYSQVGIGTTNPNTSAILDVKSNSKGILIPQVTLTSTTDNTTISNPANSLMVYNIGTYLPKGFYYNKGTKTNPAWVGVTGDCIIWHSSVAGNFNLKTIIDTAKTNGVLQPGFYNCVLKTSNEAHWTGKSFMLNVNYYTGNVTYPHQIYNVIDISAITSGCWTGGLTAFNPITGNFSFAPGVCFQSITLTCSCQGK